MGSRLSNDGAESWEKGIQSLYLVPGGWSVRSLSYHGRALVANVLGLSPFWYLASFSCMPSDTIKAINSRLFSFIWQCKREWLARSSVVQPSSQGGLGVVDISWKIQSFHVLWVRRLLEHDLFHGPISSVVIFRSLSPAPAWTESCPYHLDLSALLIPYRPFTAQSCHHGLPCPGKSKTANLLLLALAARRAPHILSLLASFIGPWAVRVAPNTAA